MERRLINIYTLSHRLDLPAAWLRREAAAHRIPSIRIGDGFFFDYHAVEMTLLKRAADGAKKNKGAKE